MINNPHPTLLSHRLKKTGLALAVLLATFLAACDTESSSTTPDTPAPPKPPLVAKTYTVTFATNADGAVFTTQTVTEGSNAVRPATDPVRADFNFIDWYKETNFTTTFSFDTEKISNDLTLYAKWQAVTYFEVEFVMSNLDRSKTTNEVSVAEGKKATPSTFKKDAYYVDGWYTTADFSGERFDFNTAITAKLTLHARWKIRRTTSQDFNVPTSDLGGSSGQGFTYYDGNFYILRPRKLYAYRADTKARNAAKDITFTFNNRFGVQYVAKKGGFYIAEATIIRFIKTNGTAVPANNIDLSTINYGAGDPRNGKIDTQQGFFIFGNDRFYTTIDHGLSSILKPGTYMFNADKTLFLDPFRLSGPLYPEFYPEFIDTGKEIYFMSWASSTVTLQYYSYDLVRDADKDIVLGTYTSALNGDKSLGMVAVGDYYYIYDRANNKVIAFHR